jgi:hypothetical protein
MEVTIVKNSKRNEWPPEISINNDDNLYPNPVIIKIPTMMPEVAVVKATLGMPFEDFAMYPIKVDNFSLFLGLKRHINTRRQVEKKADL